MTPAKKDQYDHIIEEAIDHWEGRAGVGLAFYQMAPLLKEKSVVALAKFFVPEALGDRNENVRKAMLDAAMALVNHHGKVCILIIPNRINIFLFCVAHCRPKGTLILLSFPFSFPSFLSFPFLCRCVPTPDLGVWWRGRLLLLRVICFCRER